MLLTNTWYTLELRHLSQGSSGIELYLNNHSVSVYFEAFSPVDFSILTGPLYIGGHPLPKQIEVSYSCICIVNGCIHIVNGCIHIGNGCIQIVNRCIHIVNGSMM